MSDNNPIGATGPAEGEQPGTESRRNVVAVGALAVVALGAGAFFLLGGGSAEEPATAPAVSAAVPAGPVVEQAVPVAVTLPTPTALVIGRNPFKVPGIYIPPVVAAPAEVGTGTGSTPVIVTPVFGTPVVGAPVVGTPVVGAPVVGTPVVGTPVAPVPRPPVTGTPTTGTDEKHTLNLLRVLGEGADRSAVFTIDGTEQTAKVGGIFGPTSQILLRELTEAPEGVWTATLQVGDGDPFDVVTGEPAYVQ